MDVILHLGAHRTATTTFQHYVNDQAADLAAEGIEYWGPKRVRRKLIPGLFRNSSAQKGRNLAKRAEGRVRIMTSQAQSDGAATLLVSDENLLGASISNLRAGRLYPGAGERTARMMSAFNGQVRRIVLTIRSQDLWWASACALTVSRGHPVPGTSRFEAISQSRRTWRDVITDIACAAPEVEINVLTFESYAGRPDYVLATALGREVQPDAKLRWLNRSGDLTRLRAGLVEQRENPNALPDKIGRWMPFTAEQAARLRENYADDLHWLMAGADGLAKLTEDRPSTRAVHTPPPKVMAKGQGHDERQLAQDR